MPACCCDSGRASSFPLVPVILFAYARPQHLRATLNCVRQNGVPKLYVFSDGPQNADMLPRVREVRSLLRTIDWCDVSICERKENLGLGRSVLAGVSTVLEQCAAVIVLEDDLVFVPGTYQYLCAALHHYRHCRQVMSVAAWTHPRINPCGPSAQPYFDGRACCWLWGTWARSWQGMDRDAPSLMNACRQKGLDIAAYGADLPFMAAQERTLNIWAVRWVYHHLLHEGLCLRPPWSMVDHRGFDMGTHPYAAEAWDNRPLRPCPRLPAPWPTPVLQKECAALWQKAFPAHPLHRANVDQ